MHKAPFRATNDITQTYNDGLVSVYAATDAAQPGRQPKAALTLKVTLRYEERKLGIQRAYLGKQNQVQIERVLRVPKSGTIGTQDVAITEDGRQYRIDLVQTVEDVWPASLDLTLIKIDQRYDPPDQTGGQE